MWTSRVYRSQGQATESHIQPRYCCLCGEWSIIGCLYLCVCGDGQQWKCSCNCKEHRARKGSGGKAKRLVLKTRREDGEANLVDRGLRTHGN